MSSGTSSRMVIAPRVVDPAARPGALRGVGFCLAAFCIGFWGTVGAQEAGGVPSSTAVPFSTALAAFTPQPWVALAGWDQDSHQEALTVFQQTCATLRRREAWRAICARAQAVAASPEAARNFFESDFVPYRVAPREQTQDGLMTGYFEPVLEGSAARRGAFLVPVYGTPSDLLHLDARRWQNVARDGSVAATISERQVLPLSGGADSGLPVDPRVFDSQPLDRRHRVRLEGNHIVPYWTRQQIESGTPIDAPVLAWVDDPQALYLMQVQGSGQIRMSDGRTLRLSYAEQNGHPFRPRATASQAVRTRGLPGSGADGGPEPVAIVTPVSMRTLSLVSESPAARPGGPSPGTGDPTGDEAVRRIVDALLAQPPGKAGHGLATDKPADKPEGRPAGLSRSLDRNSRTALNLGYLIAARENDPSYVFFQPAQAGGGGPVGALGVPLTATRSIAVDPRSTPLGAPVFIEAERDGPTGPLRRLMIAQDTGGAIRGAVRADFFWGTGPRAGAQAMRTKDDLAMWVLLPKGFVPPRTGATRTRAVGAPGGGLAAECVMADAEYCLE